MRPESRANLEIRSLDTTLLSLSTQYRSVFCLFLFLMFAVQQGAPGEAGPHGPSGPRVSISCMIIIKQTDESESINHYKNNRTRVVQDLQSVLIQ